MKKTLAALLLSATVMACSPSTPAASSPAAAALPASAVRHVVVFKYRPAASQAQIQQVTDAFRALQTRIPGILAFEHGINNSPEGKNLGFTHVYTLTFQDAGARDRYLPHPAHAEFGQLLGRLGVLEDAFVVDYVPGR